jgi:hypothetical protein
MQYNFRYTMNLNMAEKSNWEYNIMPENLVGLNSWKEKI